MVDTKRLKRPSTGSGDGGDSERPRKAPKVDGELKSEVPKGKGTTKVIPRSTFQKKALPIHVNFTHTPTAVIDDEGENTSSSDPGRIGGITMLPVVFSTGSYGWKGARRIAIELQGTEGKEKEKVQVMINVNATVVGSKGAAEGELDSPETEEAVSTQAADDEESKEEPVPAKNVTAGDTSAAAEE